MRRRHYDSDTLRRLYDIGGPDLALRYAEIARSQSVNRQFVLLDLRFYAGGSSTPASSERRFTSRFAKSNTRFVYFQVDMRNPWKYVTWDYRLIARYYEPDGTLMGQIEDTITTKPEWDTFSWTRGWGSNEPGTWRPGVYRVEIAVDGEDRKTEEFTVFEDQTVASAELLKLFFPEGTDVFRPLGARRGKRP
jgi:hypothetical protein